MRRLFAKVFRNPLLGSLTLYMGQVLFCLIVNRIPMGTQALDSERAIVVHKEMAGFWVPLLGFYGLFSSYALYYVDGRGRVFLRGGFDMLYDTKVGELEVDDSREGWLTVTHPSPWKAIKAIRLR